jgi:hypothetical protein
MRRWLCIVSVGVLFLTGCATSYTYVKGIAGEDIYEFWWLKGAERETTCPHCDLAGRYVTSFVTQRWFDNTYYDVYRCLRLHRWVFVHYGGDMIDAKQGGQGR